MSAKYSKTNVAMSTGGKVDDPQNAVMRQSTMDSKFAEVFVNRDEYAPIGTSRGKDCIVARIICPIANPDDVMAGRSQLFCGLAPDAGVNEKLHSPTPAAISNGSIVSLPTLRRA